MDRGELVEKARTYIGEEENDEFRSQVEEVLKKERWEELEDRFYQDLSFGTGGIRGVIGGGTNRINPLVIQKTTQGLANYILRQNIEEPTAVIAYDSRRYSPLFAESAAAVLAGNGIKTYLFTSLRPTPELSFAVRTLGATTGIVITASHNPPEYNGYKVYWSDGAQIVPPHDRGIIQEVQSLREGPTRIPLEEAVKAGKILYIDEKIDRPYIEMVKGHAIHGEILRDLGGKAKVVFTPLHGTGRMLVETILGEMGVRVDTVPEQAEPNGDFPTVEFPNPEEASAMAMAIERGKNTNADIVLGTDPDADRLGIAVPDKKGNWVLITGNQLGALLCDYILSSLQKKEALPSHPVLVKTIVTTELQRFIAESYGVEVQDVLTGFKYIGEKIREFEESGENYVFGGEESYGYLVGTEVRDKDAVSAATMTVEMTLYQRQKGRSVLEYLDDLYKTHGYFEECLISEYFKGIKGKEIMENLMKGLRNNPPEDFAKKRVIQIKDYLTRKILYTEEAKEDPIELPSSNVLQFVLEDHTIISARPSGTEPKIKFYISGRSTPDTPLNEAKKNVHSRIEEITAAIKQLIDGYDV